MSGSEQLAQQEEVVRLTRAELLERDLHDAINDATRRHVTPHARPCR
jgi:hypothetical protein